MKGTDAVKYHKYKGTTRSSGQEYYEDYRRYTFQFISKSQNLNLSKHIIELAKNGFCLHKMSKNHISIQCCFCLKVLCKLKCIGDDKWQCHGDQWEYKGDDQWKWNGPLTCCYNPKLPRSMYSISIDCCKILREIQYERPRICSGKCNIKSRLENFELESIGSILDNNILESISSSHEFEYISRRQEKKEFDYKLLSDRIKTFKVYGWSKVNIFHTPEEMAEAGFTYWGESDRVHCGYCDIWISDWFRKNNPFIEHLSSSPFCKFNIITFGLNFIRKNLFEFKMECGIYDLREEDLDQLMKKMDNIQYILSAKIYQPDIVREVFKRSLKHDNDPFISIYCLLGDIIKEKKIIEEEKKIIETENVDKKNEMKNALATTAAIEEEEEEEEKEEEEEEKRIETGIQKMKNFYMNTINNENDNENDNKEKVLFLPCKHWIHKKYILYPNCPKCNKIKKYVFQEFPEDDSEENKMHNFLL
uniref:Baculoviral IAP repeat-containing protein n=1 Tax=Metapenaeus joyneri majanivirus TaxID=2984280 RepID=A0A9C7F707_9VIRU|nr:MAG: baculoviral IAP repeat-containing protein [Metapenaeus joyneri majanivirus]